MSRVKVPKRRKSSKRGRRPSTAHIENRKLTTLDKLFDKMKLKVIFIVRCKAGKIYFIKLYMRGGEANSAAAALQSLLDASIRLFGDTGVSGELKLSAMRDGIVVKSLSEITESTKRQRCELFMLKGCDNLGTLYALELRPSAHARCMNVTGEWRAHLSKVEVVEDDDNEQELATQRLMTYKFPFDSSLSKNDLRRSSAQRTGNINGIANCFYLLEENAQFF